VGAPEPQQLVIRPFDPSTIKEIEKAIVASDLGLAPQNDGRIIRLNIPPLSTDVRKKLVTRIKELTEESKVAIRSIRRDANKAIETAEKDKVVGEDASNKAKDEVQELTKKFEASASDLAKGKEAEVMEA
jgi:ribosome recycling factor